MQRGIYRILLQRLAPVTAVSIKTKEALQSPACIQPLVAIAAAPKTGFSAQQKQHTLHIRMLFQHPGRRNGMGTVGRNQGQTISQIHRMLLHQQSQRRIRTKRSFKATSDTCHQIASLPHKIHIQKESPKTDRLVQQAIKNLLKILVQPPKSPHLILKQLPGLLRIVQGIVQSIGLQLIVLHQGVIRLFGKQKGRPNERINQLLVAQLPGPSP